MEAVADKHYKFINSKTGYVIYYYSLSCDLSPEACKAELEKVKSLVATQNAIPVHTVYWEEIKGETK